MAVVRADVDIAAGCRAVSVTEHLMRPGSGSVQFNPDLPISASQEIMALVDENAGGIGAHVVITRVRVDPALIGDAAVLAGAAYTGRITARPSRTSLEFEGIGSWLDTYNDAEITRTTGTPTQWLGDLLTNSLTAGTVSGGSNVTKTFPAHITTRREALDVIAGLGGWEYRIMPDFTVDAAPAASLFREVGDTGTIVVTRKAEGSDGALRGVDGSMLDQEIQVGNLATKAVALAEGQGVSIAKGTATAARSLRAPLGGAAAFVTVFSAPGEETANANTAASNFLNLQGMRRKVNVASSTHHLPRYVVPGDEVYIYDLAAGLYDTTQQVQFRGETIFPATVRLLSYTWPIERGVGVYIRSNEASGSADYIDVTDWVAWENGDTWWTVGDWAPKNYGRVNRTDPEIETRLSTDGQTDFNVTSLHANITSVTVARGSRLGPFEMVQIRFDMSAAPIAGAASLFTVPSEWWPATNTAARGVNINGAGAGVDLFLNTAGVVTLSSGSTAAASQPYSASFMNIV